MFVRRCAYFSLLAMTLAMSSGCVYESFCTLRNNLVCDYDEHHYMGPSCGQFYWSEWFNDPPVCCEPCNACGYYQRGGGGGARAYVAQRRRSFLNSLFGPSDCSSGDYPLDGNHCGSVQPAGPNGIDDGGYVVDNRMGGGCGAGCCGGGFTLGFHRFVDGVLNAGVSRRGRGQSGCGCGSGAAGCGCNDHSAGSGTPVGGYNEGQIFQEPTPAEPIPSPAPADTQQSKRSRVLKPAAYQDAFDDVFDDDSQSLSARPMSRAQR